MKPEQLRQQIQQARADQTNAAIQLGIVTGRLNALEEMLLALQADAVVKTQDSADKAAPETTEAQ